MSNKKLVVTTAGSQEEARRIAHALVERRLAACVNIIPSVESIYRWQGKIETAEEWMLLIKTDEAAAIRLRDVIAELHSYDLPECIAFSIEGGSEAYLNWIADSVRV
jgi:periplasmic divalent cation tolerance protein